MSSIKLAPASPKFLFVRQLLELEQEDKLNMHPYFQRNLIWPKEVKAYLIDTMMKGFPIPEIFVHVNQESKTYDIIDGQQRLDAILEFLEGSLVVPDIGTFRTLPLAGRKAFLDYPIAIREIAEVSDETVREIFRRLNTNVIPLTPQELRHARFTGPFIRLADDIASDQFWRASRVISEKEASRMRSSEFISELLIAIKEGIQEGKALLNSYYEQYETALHDADVKQLSKEFDQALGKVKELFEGAGLAYAWRTKSNFYPLFMAVHRLVKAGRDIKVQESQEALLTFITLVREERQAPGGGSSEVGQYFQAGLGGYDHQVNREKRTNALYKLLLPCSVKV